MSPEAERRSTPDRRSRSIAAQVGALEEVINGLADDIHTLRVAATEGLARLDSRVHELEDVRVRALEDWRLSERVLARERERWAKEEQHSQLSRRDLYVALAVGFLLCAATIVGALIAAHSL